MHKVAWATMAMARTELWDQRLAATGTRQLASVVGALVDRADPAGRVVPRHRRLCAGFGELATACYRALGGGERVAEVERCAALLSLLTKVDDQVIDAPGFHGGSGRERAEVERATRAYLAPTLRSMREGRPATEEGRCELGAELGRGLAGLAGSRERLDDLLEEVARGWEVQVRAVVTLSAHPGQVSLGQVEAVTTDISAVWLRMIALVGALPGDAVRTLSLAERVAFEQWGGWVQRADALADFAKDTDEGLVSSLPGYLLWRHDPRGYLDACARRDHEALYHLVRHHGVDRQCLPTTAQLNALNTGMASLGEVGSLLRWVHSFLAWRYESVSPSRDQVPSSERAAPTPALFRVDDLPVIAVS